MKYNTFSRKNRKTKRTKRGKRTTSKQRKFRGGNELDERVKKCIIGTKSLMELNPILKTKHNLQTDKDIEEYCKNHI